MHSINFHSTVRDFRTATLRALDEFLSALESKHPDLLYLHDEDLYDLITKGSYGTAGEAMRVKVTKKRFTSSQLRRRES